MNLVRMMPRKTNTVAVAAALTELEAKIAEIQQEGYILGYRIKLVAPAGTSGRPSRQKLYPRLIDTTTRKSRAIDPAVVGEYQAQIDRGRQLQRLEKQRERLLARLDKAG